MSRAIEEIKKELEKTKEQLFYEEMADFMNWGAYRELNKKIKELEQELKEAEEHIN